MTRAWRALLLPALLSQTDALLETLPVQFAKWEVQLRALAQRQPLFAEIAAGALDRDLRRALPYAEVGRLDRAGFGALRTDRGNLPLDRLDVRAKITGLTAGGVKQ